MIHTHRSHRTLASNQYIPELMKLPGHEKHVELTKKWLRGEIEIPENRRQVGDRAGRSSQHCRARKSCTR